MIDYNVSWEIDYQNNVCLAIITILNHLFDSGDDGLLNENLLYRDVIVFIFTRVIEIPIVIRQWLDDP